MAELEIEAVDGSGDPPTPDRTSSENIADLVVMELPPKRSSKQRLLQGLHRMSSSPSLPQAGRARSASAPYRGSGSLSCVSLSGSSISNLRSGPDSYFPQMSASGLATTSNLNSPLSINEMHHEMDDVLAVRRVETSTTSAQTPTISLPPILRARRTHFDLWMQMPHEIKIHVLSFFEPKELVCISRTNKEFYKMCFDGQLWTCFDASDFYKEIPAESLAKIIIAAGPFVKDLNLRGCVQVEHYKRAEVVVKSCRNLINATLEGCRNFQRTTLHSLLKSNAKLTKLNLTGLTAVTNTTCKIISQSCPQLEMFNVSWCKHMDARGIKFVVDGCPMLKDLRAGEIKGFDSKDVAMSIFQTNKLERLILAGCADLTDQALQIMMHGTNPELDILTDRPIVPARKLRHLDLSRCARLTTPGVKALGYLLPELEGLQLTGCTALTDAALEPILASTPRLTHLDVEDLNELTNAILSEHLAKAPCAPNLEHLSISYCENLGDAGILPVIRRCIQLKTVDMDNTRISDSALTEAAAMVRNRSGRTTDRQSRPYVGLTMVVYDCQNVTWPGVREVLSRNAEIKLPGPQSFTHASVTSFSPPATPNSLISATASRGNLTPSEELPDLGQVTSMTSVTPTFPTEIIALKCFYGWQMTVDEHTKRVLKGDLAAASRLERKWADYMQATEEAGVSGSGHRRRRRRAREAQQVHADEEEGGAAGILGRRRARTTGCSVM
jgi:F-box and leucine-rich repeat protein 2/20